MSVSISISLSAAAAAAPPNTARMSHLPSSRGSRGSTASLQSATTRCESQPSQLIQLHTRRPSHSHSQPVASSAASTASTADEPDPPPFNQQQQHPHDATHSSRLAERLNTQSHPNAIPDSSIRTAASSSSSSSSAAAAIIDPALHTMPQLHTFHNNHNHNHNNSQHASASATATATDTTSSATISRQNSTANAANANPTSSANESVHAPISTSTQQPISPPPLNHHHHHHHQDKDPSVPVFHQLIDQEDTCSIDDARSLSQDGTAITAMDSQSQTTCDSNAAAAAAAAAAVAFANANVNAPINAPAIATHFNPAFYDNGNPSQTPSLGDTEMSGMFPHHGLRDYSASASATASIAGTSADISITTANGRRNSRKKKGGASSAANDTELRRLLREYDGYTLKQMAHEVQKHDGNGGKAEKVKQVFAMLWLRENCRKDNGSVRRDRVYCAYADCCGNERVSVLNPASFGKLVRIIFPNVQTRRLGVRGESKYHYVDLMLNEPPQQQLISEAKAQNGFASGVYATMDNEHGTEEKIGLAQHSQSGLQPLAMPLRQFQQHGLSTDCPCNPSSTPFADLISKRDPVHKESQALIDRMLLFTSSSASSEPRPAENDTLQLPNIHQHLPPGTDPDAADALSALYRTHCISAIDNFRYCKEKNLMRQFTALAGTLTVPVHKLFVQPCLVNWIEQCDWLMYQKMLAFVAPLTTQVVPDPVLNAFASISRGLVPHIRTTLKSHPEHVSRARLVPATIFSHLLRRFLDVNQAANAAAAWLCHSDNRAKMWEEYDALIDAEEIAARAKIPRCSIDASIGIITHGAKALLMPLATMGLGVEGLYDSEMNENHNGNDDEELSLGVGLPALSLPSIQDNPFPDRWTAFLQQLPDLFPNHPAQCVLDKVENSWSAILHRLTLGGAQSFSAWWMAKVFFVEMISWQAEKEGFLQSSPPMLRNSQASLLRTSDEYATVTAGDVTQGHTHPSATGNNNVSGSRDLSLNGDSNGPNTLASFAQQQTPNGGSHARSTHFGINGNDDSAIDLGDDSILQGANGANTPATTGLVKYKDMITSDPTDADGDVVVV